MAEVSHSRKDHRDSQPIGGLDHGLIPHRTARLDHRRGAGLDHGLKPIRKGEESIRSRHRTGQWQNGLHRPEVRRIHPAHLPRADPNRLPRARTQWRSI